MTAPAIEIHQLTKSFGPVRAVDDLTFTVRPGRVTGFLGPNGAGKTTTLRMLLGLIAPTSGTATIGGRRYTELDRPLCTVGAALEASDFHPGRTARDHLRVSATQAGADDRRVDHLLELVGLAPAADRRVAGFSLGMRQRLGLAATLLGDPPVLLLDEPANGLDPEGIRWLRDLLRSLAAEGRTVLVSSHVLPEVQATVDDIVVIAQGRLVHASPLPDLVALAEHRVRVTAPDHVGLLALADRAGWQLTPGPDGSTEIIGVDPATVGHAAFTAGLELHELSAQGASLEDVFLRLTTTGAIR